MSLIIKVEAGGKHTGHFKDFTINASMKSLRDHFNAYLKSIEDFDLSIEAAKEHASTLVTHFYFHDAASHDIVIETPNIEDFREWYRENNLINHSSGRAAKGQIAIIHRYFPNIIIFWLYKAATEGLITSLTSWPPIDIQPASQLIYRGALTGLSDLSKLAVLCGSVTALRLGIKHDLFSEKFKLVVEHLIKEYEARGEQNATVYHPNFHFVLREYVISNVLHRNSVDIRDLYGSLTKLVMEGDGKSEYSLSVILEYLAGYGYVEIDGRTLSNAEYISLRAEKEFSDKESRAKFAQRNHMRKKKFDESAKGIELGKSYETFKYGNLFCRDIFGEDILFSYKADSEQWWYRPDKLIKGNEVSEFNHATFGDMFAYQRDFLNSKINSLRPQTHKHYKTSISTLNKYLCNYLYSFSRKNGYSIYDCSGSNFVNAKLALVFIQSEIVAKNIEEKFGCKIRPVTFVSWVESEELYEDKSNSKHRFFRDVMEFFQYCEDISPAKVFTNPVPKDFSKNISRSYKETSKEVFGFNEWLVWNEFIKNSLKSITKLYSDIEQQDNISFSAEDILSCFVQDEEFQIIRKLYQVSISINIEMIRNAYESYNYQYDGVWGDRLELTDVRFANAIAVIFVITVCGLRAHGAVNLPFENLVIGDMGNYKKIKVIADKVHEAGIESLLTEESLNLLNEFRSAIKRHFPKTFAKKRKLNLVGSKKLEFEGFFGAKSGIDETNLQRACDFIFYLFNELVEGTNTKLHRSSLSTIPVFFMPRLVNRGTGFNFKNNYYPGDALVGSKIDLDNIDIQTLGGRLRPFNLITLKPNRTVHGLRASFDTNNIIAGMGAEAVGYFTGQNVRTVMHYVKATPENLTLYKREGVEGLMQKLLTGEISPFTGSNVEEVKERIEQGVIQAGGKVCSPIVDNNYDNLNALYREGSKHVAIHPTHLCPFNDQCPPNIRKALDYKKSCAICPASVSFITDVPAISHKIRFHLEEANTAKSRMDKVKMPQQKLEFEGKWQTHLLEAAQWITRVDLITSNKGTVGGSNVLSAGKSNLLQFSYEDDKVLSELLTMIESNEFLAYQSEELKTQARRLRIRMGNKFDSIDPELLISDPVESVCRTFEKVIKLHKLELGEVLDRLKLTYDDTNLISMNNLLLGGSNGQIR